MTRECNTTATGLYYISDNTTGLPISVIPITENVYVDYIFMNQYGLYYAAFKHINNNNVCTSTLSIYIIKYDASKE